MTRIRRLAPLLLVVLLVPSCGESDKKSLATPTSSEPSTMARGGDEAPMPTAPTPTPKPKEPRGNSLLLRARDLYPLLGKSMVSLAPGQVTGTNVVVVALDGPETFWAGRSKSERILVHIRLKGGSPPKLRVGQKADIVGQLTENMGGAVKTSAADDGSVLARQGVYLDISIGDLKLK